MMNGICLLAQTTEEWRLQWLTAPPAWITFLLLLPAAALLAWFLYRKERGNLTPPWRWGLTLLRFALLALLFCVLFEPVYSLVKHEERSGYILVLWDVSQSMDFPDEWTSAGSPEASIQLLGPEVTSGGVRMKRLDLVKRILKYQDGAWLEGLGKKGKLRLFAFSRHSELLTPEDIERGDLQELAALQTCLADMKVRRHDGDETHIADAIQEAVMSLRGKRITAIVVFSDWRQTGGDLALESLPGELRRPEGVIPVMAVGIGSPVWPQDTRIVNFTGPDRALAGDTVSFSVTVAGRGCPPGTTARLDLLVNGEPLPNAKYPEIPADGASETIRMTHKFDADGIYDVSVRLEPLAKELDHDNNTEMRQIEIKAQTLKVLYVENLPRWDYRALKNFLMRDPTLRFQALLLSADPRFRQETSLHPPLPPLTGFPETRAALFDYDVIIMGDVDPTGDFTNDDLENIRAFVKQGGGGVVFMAGENYNPMAFAHTPLADVLPVVVEELGSGNRYQRTSEEKPFRVVITPEGRDNPVMKFVGDPERNQDLWENTDGIALNSLPGFWWFAPVMQLKKGAHALGVHPFRQHPRHGPRVIFATQRYGKGWSFFSAVDSTWRWLALEEGKYFRYFWGQAIRLVAASRLRGETARFQLSVDKTIYHPGDHVMITATVLDEELMPSTQDAWTVVLKSGDNQAVIRNVVLKQADEKKPGTFAGTVEAGSFGTYVLSFPDHDKVRAGYRVVVPQKERQDTRMDQEAAENLAAETGGRFYPLSDVTRLPDDVVPVTQQLSVTSSREPLWSTGWVIAAVVALASLEWLLRKLRRLL